MPRLADFYEEAAVLGTAPLLIRQSRPLILRWLTTRPARIERGDLVKILLVNTPQALNFRGGDLTQLRKTAEALRELGLQVSESFDAEPNGAGFDLAHVFNSRTIQVTPGQIRALKRRGVPVLMSPIYLNPSLALWGTGVIRNIFRSRRNELEMLRLQEQLRTRSLTVKRPNNVVFTAQGQNRPSSEHDAIQRQMITDVDYLLPNSYLEMEALAKTLQVCDKPFTVVPYACDPKQFLDPDPEPFVRKHGLKDFVIQAGRIELSKNQLMLVYALRNLDLPIVMVGGSLQKEYLEWCQQHGPRHLRHIPHLPADELASAYAARACPRAAKLDRDMRPGDDGGGAGQLQRRLQYRRLRVGVLP